MHRLVPLFLLFYSPCLLFADIDQIVRQDQAEVDNESVKVYGGKIGDREAVFHIEWAGENVNGWYYYPAQGKDIRFILTGTNPKQGLVILMGYSCDSNGELDSLRSHIELTKTISGGRIRWQGEMHLIDGDPELISFSRKS